MVIFLTNLANIQRAYFYINFRYTSYLKTLLPQHLNIDFKNIYKWYINSLKYKSKYRTMLDFSIDEMYISLANVC